MSHFGIVWFRIAKYGQLNVGKSNMAIVVRVCLSIMEYDPVWPNVVKYGRAWPSMILYVMLCSNIVEYHRICAYMIEYVQVFLSKAQYRPKYGRPPV